jgi:hypothetical protein
MSNTSAATPPIKVGRQPRVDPTAKITVKASTHSTSDAKKALAIVGPRLCHIANDLLALDSDVVYATNNVK